MTESRPSDASVEGLLAHVRMAAPRAGDRFELWVPARLTLRGAPTTSEVAMAVLLDALLGLGLFPAGFEPGAGGRLYRYARDA